MHGRKRIALFLDHGARGERPHERVAADALSCHLARLGYHVDLVARRRDAHASDVVQRGEAVRWIRLPVGPPEPLDIEEEWSLAHRVRDAFLRFMLAEGVRYDLLQGSSWLSGWIAVDVAARAELPVVVTLSSACLGEQPNTAKARGRMPQDVISRSHRQIVPSLRAQVALVEGHGADRDRVEVIPPGVDTDRFRPIECREARERLGLGPAGLVAAYLGDTLADADGASVVDAVERAGKRVGTPIAVLPVIGNGPIDDACDRQLRYAASDVVMATAQTEATERRALEAMACGRPVISSALDETSFALGECVTGYLVPPREPEELAERLEQLLTQPKLRARMGHAARIWVDREYAWPMVARRMAAVYEPLLLAMEPRMAHAEPLV